MHVRRALALTVLAPLVLAGCSDGDPDADPTPKMPDPTSSSPSPTESETPEAESAEDFIRRWAAAEAKMENTGDTGAYKKLSSECSACMALAKDVEDLYAAGGYLKWDGWTIRRVVPRTNGTNEFVVRVNSSPTEYKESASGDVKRLNGGPASHLLALKKFGDSWVVTSKSMVSQ